MAHRFDIWDVFTDRKFAGNQLAVVFDADDLSTDDMQAITREFNFAETSFVLSPENAEHTARVRIFTPGYEMPFAGHPTVGTSLAIAADRGLAGPLRLELKAGLFPVEISATDAAVGRATFTNPNIPAAVDGAPPAGAIEQALGLPAGSIPDDGAHRPRLIHAGNVFLYAHAPLEAVRAARVNVNAFEAMAMGGVVGILIYATSADTMDTDYHTRMFAPEAGVLEDAATGSAAAGLPGQLLRAGALRDGETALVIGQGFEMGRPSRIAVTTTIEGGAIKKVSVSGAAVRVAQGTLF